MPIPFNFTFDVGIYVSNTDQSFQILEQLLMLFNPTLNLQTSDSTMDWTKISSIELIGINTEENMPAATDKRIIVWTLSFSVTGWISAPVDIRNNIVQKIILQYGDLEGFRLFEYDEDGNPAPFTDGSLWSTDVITSPITSVNQPAPEDKV